MDADKGVFPPRQTGRAQKRRQSPRGALLRIGKRATTISQVTAEDFIIPDGYTYIRHDGITELFGSLDESFAYTVFYLDAKEKIFAVVKDVEGADVEGEVKLFDIVHFEGGYDEVVRPLFQALSAESAGARHKGVLQAIRRGIIIIKTSQSRSCCATSKGSRAAAGSAANIFQIDDGYESQGGRLAFGGSRQIPERHEEDGGRHTRKRLSCGHLGGTFCRGVQVRGGEGASRMAATRREGQARPRRLCVGTGFTSSTTRKKKCAPTIKEGVRHRHRRVGLRYVQAGLFVCRVHNAACGQVQRQAHVRGDGPSFASACAINSCSAAECP